MSRIHHETNSSDDGLLEGLLLNNSSIIENKEGVVNSGCTTSQINSNDLGYLMIMRKYK